MKTNVTSKTSKLIYIGDYLPKPSSASYIRLSGNKEKKKRRAPSSSVPRVLNSTVNQAKHKSPSRKRSRSRRHSLKLSSSTSLMPEPSSSKLDKSNLKNNMARYKEIFLENPLVVMKLMKKAYVSMQNNVCLVKTDVIYLQSSIPKVKTTNC